MGKQYIGYRVLDCKLIDALKKMLDEKKIEYRIEWKPCAVAIFHIYAEPEQVYGIKWGYYEIQWNYFFK